jgi:hypothetical protein
MHRMELRIFTVTKINLRNILLGFLLFTVATTLSASSLLAQDLQPGEWRTYTSMRQVVDVATNYDSSAAWGVTPGGAIRITLDGHRETMRALRNTDGLSDNNLTAVATDPDGNVYLGGATGTFDIYSETSGKILKLRDIFIKDDFPSKRINAISVFGDRVYLAASFGMSVYNRSTHQFAETVTKFSSLPDQDSTKQILEFGGNTYVVLADSIATINSSNLSGNWRTIPGTSGLLNSIAVFRGTLYASSNTGLFALDGTGQQFQQVTSVPSFQIARLGVGPARDSLFMFGADGNSLLVTRDVSAFLNQTIPTSNPANPVLASSFARGGKKVFGSNVNGMLIEENTGQTTDKLFPDGPISNETSDLYFSSFANRLYTAHNTSGISLFTPSSGGWLNYPPGGALPNQYYKHIFFDSVRSTTWLSMQGGGLLSAQNLETGSPTIKHFTVADQFPQTLVNDPNWITMGAGTLDRQGNFVVTNWANNGLGLGSTSDGKTFTFHQIEGWRPYGSVVEDADGNFWIATEASGSPASGGVFFLRPDGVVGNIPGNSSVLPKAEVSAVLIDQDNALWCGQSIGVRIISNIYLASSNSNPAFSSRSVPLVEQQIVHCIATDGVNNKWIGTENGVFVVSPDGSDSLAHFSTANSPLVDNTVVSIALDTKKGEAYIATPKGISRVSTVFREGKSDYSGLHVYPNPVVQTPDVVPTVYVTGLVGASTVKIYSLSGRLVASIDGSQLGATVTWNGRDETGRQLPSGVYILSASSAQTTEVGQSKFVLVRKN